MSQDQVIALFIIVIFIAGLSALTFYMGMRKGRLDINTERRASYQQTVRALQIQLSSLREQNEQFAKRCKKLTEACALKDQHHQTLLQIAEKLRIAAETFSAFKTGKKLERDARALREQALSMAALIKPLNQEQAA